MFATLPLPPAPLTSAGDSPTDARTDSGALATLLERLTLRPFEASIASAASCRGRTLQVQAETVYRTNRTCQQALGEQDEDLPTSTDNTRLICFDFLTSQHFDEDPGARIPPILSPAQIG
ncbi:hypothetical protein THAOC_08099 [Thalassiosira oceanica]|uniref:Uncharacterized protein n=1 Tax=Thalassiosira oceanica TaxID=159749 RepID=K0TIY6_THAOC|nr:hypothetical protein THAOC_08099 [Thalassiosira oceanica]|eukprot:EJK70532.1 hypothetical protein THAOC_08099 [Thalassiosira oceanica]